jgi:glycosyltransferase involved in cell wall biosynthesis
MLKPTIVLLGKRYWPAHGGSETFMQQTARVAREFGDVVIVTIAFSDSHDMSHAGLYANPPSGTPYRDPEGNLVVPPSPSPFARLLLLPLHLMRIPFVANAGNGMFRHALFAFVRLACLRRLLALCRDAVCIHSFEGNFLGGLGEEAARRLGVPFVIMPFVHPGSWGDDAFNKDLYKKANAVLTACEYEKAWFEAAGVAPSSLAAVGGYPEAKPAFSVRAKFGIQGSLILFYGRRETYKGWKVVRNAWNEISQAERTWWLALVGAGFEESIDNQKRIVTMPPPEGSPVADCDIFCMPSTSETFGLVYVEAWTHARPVIACDIPSSRELFHGEEPGLLVECEQAAVTAALVHLMRDPAHCRSMGAAGKRLVEHYYSRENYEQKIRSEYERCLGRPGL